MIDAGSVQWDGREARPAPPQLWAQAMNAVLERRPTALNNHNYLRHVAWQLAEGLAARTERDRAVRRESMSDLRVDVSPEVSEEERAEVLRRLKEFSKGFNYGPDR